MAEVRVWKVARSEADLQRDMTRKLSGNESGLVAYLPMDEGAGDVARDRGPSGFHGTRNGATWVTTPAPASGPSTYGWRSIPNSGGVVAVAVLKDGRILGVGTDSTLYTRSDAAILGQAILDQKALSPWTPAPPKSELYCSATGLAGGEILGVGQDNGLWVRATLDTPTRRIPNSGQIKSVTQLRDGTIVGVGMDNTLYTRTAAESPWVGVPSSGNVIGVTELQNGTLVGIGTDKCLYSRAGLKGTWVAVPNSGNVISIAQLPDGTLLGVGTEYSLYVARFAQLNPAPTSQPPAPATEKTPIAPKASISGQVNSSAAVVAITGNTLTLGGATNPLRPGDRVVIVQLTGATIETTNDDKFGAITSLGGAGRYVWASVVSINGQDAKLSEELAGFDAKSGKVQVITAYSHAGDVTVAGRVDARGWDGTTGGVIAIESGGTLDIAADVDASGKGFNGGRASRDGGREGQRGYAYAEAENQGWKGHGIAALAPEHVGGRGAPANGGGGGNEHNSGGGGGGNGGAGGRGAIEYQNLAAGPKDTGGLGGRSLDLADRAFLGGGGGGGQQNNSQGSAGGTGGGIILLRAQTITGTAGKWVRVNGDSARAAEWDGAGGGGAGGTIILEAATIGGAFSVEAKGGNGGDANPYHGPGGGGGGGTIRTNAALPGTVKAAVDPGNPGKAAGDTRGATAGTPGIIGPLAIRPQPVSGKSGVDADKEREALEKRVAELEAKVGTCGDCATKIAEQAKLIKTLEDGAKKCSDCADKLAEQDKKLAELTKAGIAADRKAAEQDQKFAELDKKLAEVARDNIDQERKLLEQDKKLAEQEKSNAEQERKLLEQDRKLLQQDRKLAEQEKSNAEQERKLLEQDKKFAEQDRQLAELAARAAQCAACEEKLAAQAHKLAEQERKLAELAAKGEEKLAAQAKTIDALGQQLAEVSAKAAQCAACEDKSAAQARLIEELSGRVEDLAKKLAEKSQPAPPPKPEPVDDLELIEGIGPKIAEELKAAGIRTFKQLAATSVAELQKILKAGGTKYARNDPSSWPKQAQLIIEGKKAELKALQDSLRAGRPTS
jgi:predicted flap endonuclease-1-like 5' DNA nuclease